jgi:NAD(P)H-flavin reductase
MSADQVAAARPGTAGQWAPMPFRVLEVRRDTEDTVSMDLESTQGHELIFQPGQFTMLQSFGVGEVPISISGDPGRPGRLTHTIRDVGGVTRTLCAVRPGDVLGVRGPFGRGWEVSDAAGGDVVIIAGGIGLAPLRPAVLEILADRQDYGRVTLVYGARTDKDVLFGDELHRWAEAGLDVAVTVDRAGPSWTGHVGLVTELLGRAVFEPARTLVLACGPEVMMRYGAANLVERGVPGERIRLSMERNMRCGIGLCGHCQLREHFICLDGPVFTLDQLHPHLKLREL